LEELAEMEIYILAEAARAVWRILWKR